MKINYKNFLALLLLLVIVLVFTGCDNNGDAQPQNPGPAEAGSPAGEPAIADSTDPAAEEPGPDLPEMDFGGAEIKFLVKEEGGVGRWTSVEIAVEELNGEVINDAVYMRNIIIEEKYNTKIRQEYMMAGGQNAFDMFRRINTLVMASDDTYDVVIPTLEDSARMAQEGLYTDLNALPYIDLSKQWWNQKILETTVINNKAFFATGNISILSMQATYITLFNKEIHQMLGLGDMYQTVRDGKWTIDKMLELGKTYAADLNGDGVINDLDHSGSIIISNACRALFAASGEKLVEISQDGGLELKINNPRAISVLEKIFELFEQRKISVYIPTNESDRSPAGRGVDQVTHAAQVFSGGGSLFLMGTMQNVPYMREMEADFGILPLPKYDETQRDYYSFVHTWAANACGILITAKNPERSAVILEEMAYQSMKHVTPVYYDLSIKTKFSRDEESVEMLDLIFKNRVCDLGYLYNIGGLVTGLEDLIYNKRQNTFASFIEANETKAKSELEKIIAGF